MYYNFITEDVNKGRYKINPLQNRSKRRGTFKHPLEKIIYKTFFLELQ